MFDPAYAGEFSENTQRFLPFHSLDDCPELLRHFSRKVAKRILETLLKE